MPDDLDGWLLQLRRQLKNNHQRCVLSCEGSEQWCRQFFNQLAFTCQDLLLLSDLDRDTNTVSFAKSETLLGRESELVVVDLFNGLNPDVLCIAAGLVKSGGLLVLLSPGASQWHHLTDRYGIWQNDVASPETTFIDYFFERIRLHKTACIQIQQSSGLPKVSPMTQALPTRFIDGKTSDQTAVLDGIDNWLRQPVKRIALIVAHRGRGKSTCLGFMVKKMTGELGLSVCVTAYSRQSASMVLAQCDSVHFHAPDALVNSQQSADVLVIDEAAMLPFSMLEHLCSQFKRVVMATTTGGYEGTGQGFLLRFIAHLPADQFAMFKLHQPVRWADNDYLENWVNDTFCLESKLSSLDVVEKGISIDLTKCCYRVIDRRVDRAMLSRVYQLMASAHYRTRPSDFRALMENPDLIPLVAQYQSSIIGVALLNSEGGLDTALSRQIFLGNRRPRGHLLSQMLTAQAGLRDFACFKGLRIQRIAVSENQRRQGIGRRLIDTLEAYASKNNFDYIGASFAFDSEAAGFWQSSGFRLVHIGYGQGKSSGNHSVAVIKSMSPVLDTGIVQLQKKLRSSLPLWFCQFLNHMNVADTAALLRYAGYRADLTDMEIEEIEAFTQGHKGFELCFVTLQKFVMQFIAVSSTDRIFHPWLIEKVIQNRNWHLLSPEKACSGRKAAQNKIRRLVGELII